jgi:hypothetical protein
MTRGVSILGIQLGFALLLSTGGAIATPAQAPGWTTIGRGTATTYHRETDRFELYVDVVHEVRLGEIGVTFLFMAQDNGNYTITRETTRFMGADGTGTLYLELEQQQASMSQRRAASLEEARAGSLDRYSAALSEVLRGDDEGSQPRRIMLPTTTPDAGPEFTWLYVPQTLPDAPFPGLRVAFRPDGYFDVRLPEVAQ